MSCEGCEVRGVAYIYTPRLHTRKTGGLASHPVALLKRGKMLKAGPVKEACNFEWLFLLKCYWLPPRTF